MSVKVRNIGKTDGYVYDISLDGTVVCASNGMVLSNTDGMNMSVPESYRYTEDNPYIGKGLGRNVKEGVKYTGAMADVMEFEDLFMRKKMGLDIDERLLSSANSSRKNYIDRLHPDGKLKIVGNTFKSKTMPKYIEDFINEGVVKLLSNGTNGKPFLDLYYDYVERIFNYRIPLKDICSKGKIKVSLDEYREKCKEVTKSGSSKPRQVWYELAIENGINCDIGSTIYFVNTGTKKGDGNTVKKTKYYAITNEGKKDVTRQVNSLFNAFKKNTASIDKKATVNIKFYLWLVAGTMKPTEQEAAYRKDVEDNYKKYVKNCHSLIQHFETEKRKYTETLGRDEIVAEEELTLNCKMIPAEIIESDSPEALSSYGKIEYNADKYLDAFNSKMRSFLVCFKPEIRFREVVDRKGNVNLVDNIIVTNPSDRPYFSDEDCELDHGHPLKPGDQDTYEELMSMDRREIDFWVRTGKTPPFCDVIGMDWGKIKDDYRKGLVAEDTELYRTLDAQYLSILETITNEDVAEMYETGEIPLKLRGLVFVPPTDGGCHFHFIELPDMRPSTGGYVFEDIAMTDSDEPEEEFTE